MKIVRFLSCLAAAFAFVCMSASAQGVYVTDNVWTSANNVPPGAQAPMYTVPFAKVTICGYPAVNSPCTNTVSVYDNEALSGSPLAQPLTADKFGRYAFFIANGTYSITASTSTGTVFLTSAFTAGAGTGGGVVLLNPGNNQTITQAAGTTLSVNSLNKNLNPLVFAGADFGAKVNTAIASCTGTTSCSIVVPQIEVGSEPTWTTPIVFHANVHLSGAGRDVTNLKYTGESASIAISIPSGANNSGISDLTLTSTVEVPSVSTYNNVFGIDVAADNVTIDNIHLAHFWGYGGGINFTGNYGTLQNSVVEYATFVVNLRGSNHKILHNTISNHYSQAQAYEDPGVHYWDGIAGEGLSQTLIEGNTVYDNGQSGIYTGGNASVSLGNRILGNEVIHNWNRGIDQGLSGTQSGTNSINEIVVTGNRIIDSLSTNIWFTGINRGVVSGNLSEYTSNYSTYFGARANPSAHGGIALTEICTSCTASYNTVTGNTVIDSAVQQNISFNVALGTGNVVAGNSINQFNFLNPSLNLATNYYQGTNSINSTLAGDLFMKGASQFYNYETTNGFGGNRYINGAQKWVAGNWGDDDYSVVSETMSGNRPFRINKNSPSGALWITSAGYPQNFGNTLLSGSSSGSGACTIASGKFQNVNIGATVVKLAVCD